MVYFLNADKNGKHSLFSSVGGKYIPIYNRAVNLVREFYIAFLLVFIILAVSLLLTRAAFKDYRGLSDRRYMFIFIAIIGAIITNIMCIRQTDLKALIAYSSVNHIGLVTIRCLSNIK